MKVPPFLSDLYFDLRDRRLLPVVGLILVAIVATPILLAGSSEPEVAPAPNAAPVTGATPSSDTLTVVKAEPGLRNYKKRLARRSPTNPFKQRFAGPRHGPKLNEKTSTSTASSSSSTESTGSVPAPVPPSSESTGSIPSPSGGGSTGGGNQQLPPGLTTFTYAADIQITKIETKPDGSVVKTGPTLHKEVVAPTPLPGEKAPVVTYLGAGAKSHMPLFLVSPEVTAVFGEGECVAGTSVCQLLALEPGFPETLEYGPNGVRYKVNVVKIKPVISGKT
ncbi:MAG: hypothetical protein ACTHN3_02695 [Solirubrobacterales bacterium]